MLSANQINAQVKLTEMWKAVHVPNYPIRLEKKDINSATNHTRSLTRGDLILQGKNELCKSSLIHPNSGIKLLIILGIAKQSTKQKRKFVNLWLPYLSRKNRIEFITHITCIKTIFSIHVFLYLTCIYFSFLIQYSL